MCVCVCDLPSRAIAVPMLSNALIINNLLGSAAVSVCVCVCVCLVSEAARQKRESASQGLLDV